MFVLDVVKIYLPIKDRNFEDKLYVDTKKPHYWFALYPVKTPNGWALFQYVKRIEIVEVDYDSTHKHTSWKYL